MILFDDPLFRNQLKPLTFTRPVADLRVGILTIAEKWELLTKQTPSYLTEPYLQDKFTADYTSNLYINGSVIPNESLWNEIKQLSINTCLIKDNCLIALKSTEELTYLSDVSRFPNKQATASFSIIKRLPDLFLQNGQQIEEDIKHITKNRISAPISDPHTRVYGLQNIFIEEGATIKASTINAENGSVYIGKNAVIQEGSLLIGPVAIGEHSMVAYGAKIRPNTTLGPVCRVGGEVGNSIFMGYSNKAHDGFLGNSIIGEWCNLGANTNNSNLKNDYQEVKLYDYNRGELASTDELFCGTFMGDFSKAGISTMFNTGTVIGVSCNVFGAGFQEKFMPSFSWGGKTEGIVDFRFDKAIQIIQATMARREKSLTDEDIKILRYILENEK
jgi:UDP-N-acetylglucosamine diphosphorylase / glucose-1-phosphate thymidylyltransferase / UDP-N-acetylgalactosamine diphosphorylase / glucosamine-1-phosphate N-acetyltransferase / galactosamine-1-phosphate N-acetyltransferase